jgi:hypothetical protein
MMIFISAFGKTLILFWPRFDFSGVADANGIQNGADQMLAGVEGVRRARLARIFSANVLLPFISGL